jgi:hypothetical protein
MSAQYLTALADKDGQTICPLMRQPDVSPLFLAMPCLVLSLIPVLSHLFEMNGHAA